MSKKILAVFLSLYFVMSLQIADAKVVEIINPSFENSSGSTIDGWSKSTYKSEAGVTEIKIDETVARSGNKSILIINSSENDSRIQQEIKVKEGYYYKISCYVKTEDISVTGKGANISGYNLLATSKEVKGTTTGWEYIEFVGKALKGQQSYTMTLGVGGYGSMNIGKAWFDEVNVEELETLPEGVAAVDLMRVNNSSDNQSLGYNNTDYNDTKLNIYAFSFMLIVLLLFMFVFNSLYVRTNKEEINKNNLVFYLVLIFGFALRIMFASRIEGYSTDMNCFKAWSSIIADNFLSIYDGSVFMDYPPGIVYILALPGAIVKLFKIYTLPWAYALVIKMPAILADIFTSIILFRISRARHNYSISVFVCAVYLFNPAVFINSAIWGQVDSILVMLIVAALYLLYIDKLELSAVLFAAAVMIKPQGIILLPVLLFELLRKGSIKRILVSAAYGFGTILVIALPFAFDKEPLWIFNLFLKTASGYKGASVNAFNLFGLIGANWKSDSDNLFIFSYFTWGMIFIVLITAFVLFLFLKGKNGLNPYIASAILVVGVFTFSSRMHERYMFPAVALLLMVYILLNDVRFMLMYAITSITVFSNTWIVFALSLHNNYWVSADSGIMRIVGLVNILLFIYLIKVTLSMTEIRTKNQLKNKEQKSKELKN